RVGVVVGVAQGGGHAVLGAGRVGGAGGRQVELRGGRRGVAGGGRVGGLAGVLGGVRVEVGVGGDRVGAGLRAGVAELGLAGGVGGDRRWPRRVGARDREHHVDAGVWIVERGERGR